MSWTNDKLSDTKRNVERVIKGTLYLFVYFGPAFDLGHNHSHDASPEGGSEGEELLVGGDVLIPWVWVPGVKKVKSGLASEHIENI